MRTRTWKARVPRQVDGALAPETVEAVISDPRTRRDLEHIRDTIIAQAKYALRLGQPMPSVTSRSALDSLLSGLQTQERTERENEQKQHFAAMREFVQAFRHLHGRPEDDEGE